MEALLQVCIEKCLFLKEAVLKRVLFPNRLQVDIFFSVKLKIVGL